MNILIQLTTVCLSEILKTPDMPIYVSGIFRIGNRRNGER